MVLTQIQCCSVKHEVCSVSSLDLRRRLKTDNSTILHNIKFLLDFYIKENKAERDDVNLEKVLTSSGERIDRRFMET